MLGGTSLIGRFLLPRAVERDLEVTALSRVARDAGDGAAWVVGDLAALHPEDLPQARAILSLSPIWLLPDALPALAATGARRLLAFSSTSRLTKIASPDPAERRTAERLADGEDRTRRACEDAGIAWTLLRPTMIYAEGEDQNISRLARLIARFGMLPLSGAGEGLRQPVHAADLAEAALAMLDRPETFGRIYDLPGGETLTYRQMVERIFEGLGRSPHVYSVPPPVWRTALAIARPVLPGATAAMGERMAEDLVFDAEPARRDFGWSPRAFHPDFRLSSRPS